VKNLSKLIISIALALLVVVATTGCNRVTTLKTIRESDFDRETALAIHMEAYRPIYQFILDFYPKEGPRHERFQTRADILDYMSKTLPADVAKTVTRFFVGDEAESLTVHYDVFFPTPFHSGVVVKEAYIERVEWPNMGRVDRYLVVIDRYTGELSSLSDTQRETRYTQDTEGVWRLHSIFGMWVVSGAMYSPHGLRD